MRAIHDKTYTVGLPTASGPAAAVIPMNLPDGQGEATVKAWIGNFGTSNVYLFQGIVSLATAINRLANDPVGPVDCLMALSSSGPTEATLDGHPKNLTVFFETVNSSGQTEAVTLRVRVYE